MRAKTPAWILLALACWGCGGSPQPDDAESDVPGTKPPERAGQANVQTPSPSAANDDPNPDLFPPPKPFPPIEFEPVRRDPPKSADEALATIEAIRKLYASTNVPPPLNQDLDRESVYQTAKAVKLIQLQAPLDVAWLEGLQVDGFPAEDRSSWQRVESDRKAALSRIQEYLPKEIEFTLKHTANFIADSLAPLNQLVVSKAAELDMSDQNQVRNLLGNELLVQSRREAIARLSEGFEAAILFDDMLGTDSGWATKRDAFRNLVTRYQQNLAQAAEAITLPNDIGDEELARIAAEALRNPKYGLPPYVKLIVNAPKRSHAKDHYLVDFDERSVTKSKYRWEEFQVATVEQEGETYFLYYTTLLKYSNGPATVPLGQWVLGPRHKSAPIAPKNFSGE